MDINNAIEIRNLYKYFKVVYDKPQTLKERLVFWNNSKVEKRIILKNISLNIKKGETVALVGVNGSGKSTLLKLMTKILYPNSGTLETQGKLTSLLELGAGFHPDFTGRENIYFNASIFGLTRQEIERRIDDIIIFSELDEYIDNPIRTYSSGMYMRLAFSIAINVDAEILLIDEILAVGDQRFQDKCFNKLLELKNSDKTIVIVSHSLDTVRKLCDRAIWIYEGELMSDGDPLFVIEEYLNRIAADHSELRKDKEPEKKEKYTGKIFIDYPHDCEQLEKTMDFCKFYGWALSDCLASKLKVYIDNSEIEMITRKKRLDVLIAFEDHYGGLATNVNPGWEVEVDLNLLEKKRHFLKIEVLNDQEEIVKSKEIEFEVK